jgi:hypothetical protein
MKTSQAIRLVAGLVPLCGILLASAASAQVMFSQSDTVTRNVDANYCEAFVERGALVFGNGQHMSLRFYIKIHPERLDGPVNYVGFHGYKFDLQGVCKSPATFSNPACQNVGIWADYKSKPFVYESDDYHDIRLDVSDIDGDIFVYEGVFFVQTDVGTRYWVHPNNQRNNFLFSEEFLDGMVAAKSAFDLNDFDVSKIPPARSTSLGLNTRGCE